MITETVILVELKNKSAGYYFIGKQISHSKKRLMLQTQKIAVLRCLFYIEKNNF